MSPVEVGSEDDGQPHAYIYDYNVTNVEEALAMGNASIYGALYNLQAVQTWNLCPSGWAAPTLSDWSLLTYNIPPTQIASTSWFGTDDFQFDGLPAGDRDGVPGQEAFHNLGSIAHWWSQDGAMIRIINQSWSQSTAAPAFGFSVRCIKE